ncbi:MAG: EF-P lysine aminoacylase EpmA [Thiohalocapsa sp.]
MSADDAVTGWQPSATGEVLAARARMLARIRAFFTQRDVMEVETPILSRHGATDPALESLRIQPTNIADAPWLQTSPEFPMKRLLAAGTGPIYQICKVFRDDERGRRHHPEFTLLEWYRPEFTMQDLIDEVAELVRAVLDRPGLNDERISYRELFRSHLGLDPWSASTSKRRDLAMRLGVPGAGDLDLDDDGWLDLLLSHALEPTLGRDRMTFVYDYPPTQASLARIRGGVFPVAERFELYMDGIELANGFQELTDAAEQRQRFESERDTRRRRSQVAVPMDTALLDALSAGMPDTAGVALGLDRLLMIGTGAAHIDQVLAFPIERA